MSTSGLPQQISDLLKRELSSQDPDVQIQVKHTSLGWLHLKIITTLFENLPETEREKRIDTALEELQLTLGNYPFSHYYLLTPQEAANEESVQATHVPLWSDILMAPDPDHPVPLDRDTTKRPLVVTFYSFKGGVGRSTALGFVANILATRGYRVVMIDFDLEAPGLSFLFPTEKSESAKYGVLDYIHQRFLTPDENIPDIAECMRQIELPVRGELYLVPSGEYDEGYVHRLADFDVHLLYQQEKNPIHQLVDDVKEYLDPDIILIDARTGLTDIGAIALLDQADLGILCFSPTEQSFAGLQWVVKAASKQRTYHGFPDLRFVLTPMPIVAPEQQQIWLARTAEWITANWELPPFVTVNELYYRVPYNSVIATLSSLADEMPPGILEVYYPIVDAILANLLVKEAAFLDISRHQQAILAELRFQTRSTQELDSKEIPIIFQQTGIFPKFLQNRTWFVRGAKGTGKTFLFRLFIDQAKEARKIAAQEGFDLEHVHFVPGYGPATLSKPLLTSQDLESYEQSVAQLREETDHWWVFWQNYIILQIVFAFPELRDLPSLDPRLVMLCTQTSPQKADILSWLIDRFLASNQQSFDELRALDQWWQQRKQRVWLLYDNLDQIIVNDPALCQQVIEALVGWWGEMGSSFRWIIPKIFLREDSLTEARLPGLLSSSSRSLRLYWQEEDIWRLVLHQALSSSPTLAHLMSKELSVDVSDLNKIEKDLLRQCLYLLWGERIDRGNRVYADSWLWRCLSDGRNNHFPRTFLHLLQHAVDIEKTTPEKEQSKGVLCTQSLIDASFFASQQRVRDMHDEYPEFAPLLTKLSGEYSPISLKRLMEIRGEPRKEVMSLIARMIDAGILQEYFHSPEISEQRYEVAELYLYGLGMKHRGQR